MESNLKYRIELMAMSYNISIEEYLINLVKINLGWKQ